MIARLALVVILCGVVCANAIAGAGAAPSNTVLADARKLSRKGNHAGAAKLLAKARHTAPKDAQLLSELGWQWFLAHDLPHALEATNAAVSAATTPAVKAASLYNLGRIKEALGKRDEAVSAYAESLSWRPLNPTVLRRLADLDPKKAAELDPDRLVVHEGPLEGPFPSIAAWCGQLRDGECGASLKDDESLIAGPHEPAALRPPYQAVAVFVVDEPDDTVGDCALAVQLASGWYVRRVVEACRDGGVFSRPETLILEITTEPGAPGPEIFWVLRVNFSYRNNVDKEEPEPEKYLITCGVGPSGKPSCIDASF